MAQLLSKLFIRSFCLGTVPASWSEANVTPIFKKGKRTDAANYRPISLLSVLLKIMERLLRDAILGHLLSNGLLSKAQHGFVHRRSCTTNLLESLDAITEALNRGFGAVLVLLDFAKAFDSVPHRELLHKLKAYGLDEATIAWLSSYLSNRRRRRESSSTSTCPTGHPSVAESRRDLCSARFFS